MIGLSLDRLGETAAGAARRTIPFDVAFRFSLVGERERVHRDTVTISIEATYVALSIGYGVVPVVEAQTFGPRIPEVIFALPSGAPGVGAASAAAAIAGVRLRDISLGTLLDGLADALDDRAAGQVGPGAAAVFTNGLKLNAAFASQVLADDQAVIDRRTLNGLFQAVAAPADRVQFRYALFDDATGREFQSQPILNTAGLGAANGDRPFRYFARPVAFAPRSTIRLEITEESEFAGELHVALQGYKVLGGAGSPTGRDRGGPRGRRMRARVPLRPRP